MKKTTREWVRKAEADFRLARAASREKPPLHDGVCFHCQQCAEKYLKALLEQSGQPVPRTHNLDDLLNQILPTHPTLRTFRRRLQALTKYGVDYRYPGEAATNRQAAAALIWMDGIRTAVRKLLGIRMPRNRRKNPP